MRKLLVLAAGLFFTASYTFAAPLSEAVGFYSKGSLLNAEALSVEGAGYMKLFVPRNRNWSTHDLNELLRDVAQELKRVYPKGERLQIGDQSARRGGQISGHASHQNGLDVDVAYLRRNHHEQSPNNTKGFEESFVKNGKITKNFDIERNWAALKLMNRVGSINRIFMDVAIKRTFCEYAKAHGELESEAETLRHLRPYSNHDDHMHVRIECPRGNSRCVSQPEAPPGAGCSPSALIVNDGEL